MALKLLSIFVLSAFTAFIMTEARSMGGFGSGPSGLGGPGAGFSLSDILQNEDIASSFLGGVANTDPEQLELPFLTVGQAAPEQLELFRPNQDFLRSAASPKIFDGKK
ncbi:Hypp6043 [Branchiostoma lanceolatum]|uniref:Hypp6043 protein n=1 Tax=Branchiostoma lanceolatum TaxID=7740 RepID=A0A8J9VTD1_BRALA|nr:Hypp6043 [Branchiostoma lanceolatum]